MVGRSTPGPKAQQQPGSQSASSGPGSMPPSTMAPMPPSHGSVRGYGVYGPPPQNVPQMHPNAPYGPMGPSQPPPQTHPSQMGSHHGYSQQQHSAYTQSLQSPMHPQSQHQQYIPMMMPPPSQYPNKGPNMPPQQPVPSQSPGQQVLPGGHPPPGQQSSHHPMMSSDRSSLYYGSRFGAPPQSPLPHGPPLPNSLQPQQHPYYMRPPMSQPQPGGKSTFYTQNNGAQYSGPPAHGPGNQMMQGHPQQPHPHHLSGQMMMQHHHASMGPQMQQQHGKLNPTTNLIQSIQSTNITISLHFISICSFSFYSVGSIIK